jgi:hypothetical protein
MEALMEITYTEKEDGMLYPNIVMAAPKEQKLGKYGLMAMEYLRENYPDRYRTLSRFGLLQEKLSEVDGQAYRMIDRFMEKYLKKHQPEDKNSTMERWRIRRQGMEIIEEIVVREVVNRFH